MGRFPFYAYPSSPYSFYAPPAEAYFHRPFSAPPSSPAPPAPTPRRSVINVPVYDSSPLRPSPSPPQPVAAAVPLIDTSSAATRIQSHFRGFCVRRHHPLLHLRTIARARKQLEELQLELERPEFSLKLRESEKERMHFNESIMAIILRLDAIEGSMAEVKSQRKEATKMAIKLQDAIDAIMMQKDEIAALDSTADEGGMTPCDDSVLIEQPQEPLHPEIDMVDMLQEEANELPANGIMDVNTLQEHCLFSEDNGAGTCMMPNIENSDVMDMGAAEHISASHPLEMEDLGQKRGAGLVGVESVPQVQHVKAMHIAEQDLSHLTGENAGSHATRGDTVATHASEEEVENGIDDLHPDTHGKHMQNDFLGIKVDQGTCVDDAIDVGNGYAARESTDGTYACGLDVVQEGVSQHVELCPGTPTAEEKCDYPYYADAAHVNEFHGPLAGVEKPTEGIYTLDVHCPPALPRRGYEECSNDSHEAKCSDEVKAQAFNLSMAETPSMPHDNTIFHQLSEDCRQLKSLVGKLLVQNKAQSNILGRLAERLEMLEHQQQRDHRHNQQKMCEKRKLKGSKRSVKRRNCEEC